MHDLMVHWDRTRDSWRDSRAREFEARVLEPLGQKVDHTAQAMDRMALSIQRARSECGPISGT
jgi:hypothetical protein